MKLTGREKDLVVMVQVMLRRGIKFVVSQKGVGVNERFAGIIKGNGKVLKVTKRNGGGGEGSGIIKEVLRRV